ncbi:MAG: Ig-like domain-containing protein [Gemmatimonadaceae bacterium]
MTRPSHFLLFAIPVVRLVAGCTGDAPTVPALVAPTVRLTGDSVVAVASRITLSAQGTDSAGKPVAAPFYWTSSAQSIADVSSAGIVTGRAAGTATITASSRYASATITVKVRDDRPSVALTVGESFTGRFAYGVATERIAVSVTAGDTLDLLVRMDSADASMFGARLQSSGADWLKASVQTSHGIALYGAVVPLSTGVFTMEVVGGKMDCGGQVCVAASLPYTVRVRRSAPIFNVSRYYERSFFSLPQGALARDSVWAQNIGLGTVTVRVASVPPWVRTDAASVALAGPKAGGSSPDVATAIGFTVDTRGLAQGVHLDSLELDGSTGEWSTFRPFGRYSRRVEVRVTDSSARLLPTPARLLRLLAAAPDGRLYGVDGEGIVTVDLVSGTTTLVRSLSFWASDIAVGADGSVYVGRSGNLSGGVFRLTGSSLEPVLISGDCENVFVVLPNDTVYSFCGTSLYRSVPGRGTERLDGFASTASPTSVVYRSADDALYVMYGTQLVRYDPARQEFSLRGTVTDIGTFKLFAVDGQGRLVGAVPLKYEVRVLDTNATVLDLRALPDIVADLAIVGNTIFVTSLNGLWRLPVR